MIDANKIRHDGQQAAANVIEASKLAAERAVKSFKEADEYEGKGEHDNAEYAAEEGAKLLEVAARGLAAYAAASK